MTLAPQLARFEALLDGIDPALLGSLAPGLDDRGVEALRRALAPAELDAEIEELYRWRAGGPLPLFFGAALLTPTLVARGAATAERVGVLAGAPVLSRSVGSVATSVEFLLTALCDAAEAAGDSPYARRAALTSPAPEAPASVELAGAPAPEARAAADAPTHDPRTIADLVEESHTAEVVGTVGGRIVDAWKLQGYTEYRLADGADTLVLGIRDPEHDALPSLGDDVLVTVRIRRGATAITEPIDPRRPSVLGAVPADYLGHSAA